MSVLSRLRLAVHATVTRHVARATWVEGNLEGSGRPFRCLFAGDSLLVPYVMRRMYAGNARVVDRRRVRIRALPALARSADRPVDLCVAVLPRECGDPFAGMHAFRTQEWVCQVVDLPPTWDELTPMLHRTPRGTGRLIRKHGLTMRLSNDAADFQFFYHRMFVPHTRKQYGDLATIESFEEMEVFFKQGFLLLVEEAGHPVAGSLCLMDESTLTYRRMGVLDADEAHIRKGAQMAVYYFSLQLAVERGLRAFDLMKSRPFFEDGVYAHKRKWGATTHRDDESETWVWLVCPGSPGDAAPFVAHNPLVVHAGQGLRGLVGLERGQTLSPEREAELREKYDAPGLDGLTVLSEGAADAAEIALTHDARPSARPAAGATAGAGGESRE